MSKFTPGPWKAVDARDYGGNPCGYSVWQDLHRPYSNSPRGRKICQTPDGTTADNRANARLIAAAPAMYEALQKILAIKRTVDLNLFDIEAIHSIAKAALRAADGGD